MDRLAWYIGVWLFFLVFAATGCRRQTESYSEPATGDAPLEAAASAHKLPTAALHFPNGHAITVDVARTPKTREIGLMFRDSLPADYGMLFVFPNEGGMQFWMKNTWVDLDMLFIDGKKRVTVIHKNVPRSSPDTPEPNIARRGGVGQYVLELPAGAAARYGLKTGQSLVFDVPIPSQ